MASSILGVGQSALAAAQIGLTTTAHNIANANTPGYSRQIVIQGAAGAQDMGAGFIGKGTQILAVQRVYNEYLNAQVVSAQTSAAGLTSYYNQIKQLDNMVADSSAGISPALQEFFSTVRGIESAPNSPATRQAMLSSAEAMVARFQTMDTRLSEIRQGVDNQIAATVTTINGYASQIAALNEAIDKAQGPSGNAKPANDLLDQRDQLVADLSKEVKVSVVKQGNGYNVFIGNGQPLVVNSQTYELIPTVSRTDLSRAEIGYSSNGKIAMLSEDSFAGGNLGGMLEFRAKSLDAVQNELGRVAIGMAMAFNAQHALGQDKNGAIGGQFFNVASPVVSGSTANSGDEKIGVTISNPSALTASDYRIRVTGGNYEILRLSDNVQVYSGASLPATTVDGLDFSSLSGASADGDEYLIRPTLNGASQLTVAITDVNKIAAASPIRTGAGSTNTGTGKINAGTVNAPAPTDVNLQQPVKITFTSATTFDVTGTGTGDPTGVTFTPGQPITYNGWTVTLNGAPAVGDTFTVSPNTGATQDASNATALAALQTKNTLVGGSATFQGAYAQLVSRVGTKTHELEVTSAAAAKLLDSSVAAQQAESGVNLDEEATNMLRYQQAYSAAGRIMQTASQLFELLLTLGQ
jgi:flagellar hook-associated protein 1